MEVGDSSSKVLAVGAALPVSVCLRGCLFNSAKDSGTNLKQVLSLVEVKHQRKGIGHNIHFNNTSLVGPGQYVRHLESRGRRGSLSRIHCNRERAGQGSERQKRVGCPNFPEHNIRLHIAVCKGAQVKLFDWVTARFILQQATGELHSRLGRARKLEISRTQV